MFGCHNTNLSAASSAACPPILDKFLSHWSSPHPEDDSAGKNGGEEDVAHTEAMVRHYPPYRPSENSNVLLPFLYASGAQLPDTGIYGAVFKYVFTR